MLNLSSSRGALLAAAFLVGTAVLLAATGRVQRDDPHPRHGSPPSQQAKSSSSREVTVDEVARLEREIRGMTPRQVRDALPETAERDVFALGGGMSRTALLFRRLGELEGEAALDEILARYGRGDFTANAMTQAVLGWMRIDRKAAQAAFLKLIGSGGPSVPLAGMSWRGESLISIFG